MLKVCSPVPMDAPIIRRRPQDPGYIGRQILRHPVREYNGLRRQIVDMARHNRSDDYAMLVDIHTGRAPVRKFSFRSVDTNIQSNTDLRIGSSESAKRNAQREVNIMPPVNNANKPDIVRRSLTKTVRPQRIIDFGRVPHPPTTRKEDGVQFAPYPPATSPPVMRRSTHNAVVMNTEKSHVQLMDSPSKMVRFKLDDIQHQATTSSASPGDAKAPITPKVNSNIKSSKVLQFREWIEKTNTLANASSKDKNTFGPSYEVKGTKLVDKNDSRISTPMPTSKLQLTKRISSSLNMFRKILKQNTDKYINVNNNKEDYVIRPDTPLPEKQSHVVSKISRLFKRNSSQKSNSSPKGSTDDDQVAASCRCLETDKFTGLPTQTAPVANVHTYVVEDKAPPSKIGGKNVCLPLSKRNLEIHNALTKSKECKDRKLVNERVYHWLKDCHVMDQTHVVQITVKDTGDTFV